ncbi:unknown [Dialister sp. CAG:357]|nr:unknown [Dialister sp. CAG:357]
MAVMLLRQDAGNDASDIGVTLVDDDGFGIIVHFIFAVLDVRIKVSESLRIELQCIGRIMVSFKYLDGIPTDEFLVHFVMDGFFNVRNGVFYASGEYGRQAVLPAALGSLDGSFSSFLAALALQRGDFHDFAAQFLAHLLDVDLVPALLDEVHHVDCHDDRQPDFNQLCGEVQVSFQICTIDDIQNHVRLFVDKVISCYLFFQCIRGQRIDPRKILDNDILVSFKDAVLLFYGDAGPVSHILVAAGQFIKQCRLAAVRIARKGDSD